MWSTNPMYLKSIFHQLLHSNTSAAIHPTFQCKIVVMLWVREPAARFHRLKCEYLEKPIKSFSLSTLLKIISFKDLLKSYCLNLYQASIWLHRDIFMEDHILFWQDKSLSTRKRWISIWSLWDLVFHENFWVKKKTFSLITLELLQLVNCSVPQ